MRLRTTTAATAVLTTAFTVYLTGTASAADLDCKDFSSQAQAQAHYDADTSDPDNLDADDDGQACENYDYGTTSTSTQVASTPVGAVEAGDGSLATSTDDDTGVLPYALGGAAFVAAGGAGLAARRSARGSA